MANVLRVSFLPSTPPQFVLKPGAHHGLLLLPHPSLPLRLCPSCCSGLNLCPSSVAVSMMNTTEASGGEQAGGYFTEQQETEGKSGQL